MNAQEQGLDPRAAGGQRLKGKIAIVTGAGQGHGRATARRMAQEGAAIMICDRYEPGATRTRDELRDFGAEAEFYIANLRDSESAKALMVATYERFGRIDILVNNVGGAIRGGRLGWEQQPDELRDNVENNLFTCLWCCCAVMPYMVEQRSGAIVNFGSHSVRGTLRLGYAAAKGGVMAITTSLALEAAPYGIRVNCVIPHTSSRPAGDNLISRTGEISTRGPEERVPNWDSPHYSPIALRRPGTPEEVAAAVTFLASDDASFTTGEFIGIGGGAFYQL